MKKNSDHQASAVNPSRREVLKGSALAMGAMAATGLPRQAIAQNTLLPLPITVAGYQFDRFAALIDGRIGIEGCDATYETQGIGDMNTHVFSGPGTREVTEIGLHPFMLAYANQNFRDYTLLPIFPLRLFRHKSVFIRVDSGIEKPEDLRGRTVATPGYSSTSLTWIRGILQDEYGVAPTDIDWIVAAKDSSAKDAGKASQQENVFPEGISITVGPEGQDESDLLVSGAVDALFHAAEPRAFVEEDPRIARLFPDSRTVERDYYARTGIFPIMHAIAIRRDVAAEHPWLAKAVFDAYSRAKQTSYDYMVRLGWVGDMLPWYGQELAETRALMGDNFYSYGIGSNRKTLEALFRYSHQQGLASHELTIEELFLPSSLEFAEPIG
jgi:4,5-dihydroxyphthalate decarboxylase